MRNTYVLFMLIITEKIIFMDHFQTKEGKLLYIIYNLYKQNKISIEQRHILKGK